MARAFVVVATAALIVAGLATPGSGAQGSTTDAWRRLGLTGPGHRIHFGRGGEADVNVCAASQPAGFAHCDAHVRSDLFGQSVRPRPGATANGVLGIDGAYDPSYLQSAYNAPSATNGSGQTVAVVDAFDAPNAEADLATYRSQWGLSPCTTANGCFTKIDQNGGTNYPAADASWELETSLDVDMVSAICPRCHILLVEATDPSVPNLGAAVNTAVSLGANAVSNSYGSAEWPGEPATDTSSFDHPGVAIVASSGDSGYGVNYPAASPGVVAVGGTSLLQATNTGSRDATETAWSGAGSGCSAFEAKPVWQTDTGCIRRTVADVAAVADPNTGVWAYDGGWYVVGGTSVAAPIVGGLFALAQNSASTAEVAAYPYAHPAELNDIVSGSTGNCGGSYLCTGSVGYDGPTGLGTLNAIDAFTPGAGPALPAPDFSLTVAPVPITKPGSRVTSAVTITSLNGFGGIVHLSATYTPSLGLTKSFSPVMPIVGAKPGESTLTIAANKAGVYTLTVKATAGSLTHTRVITVKVNDFSLHVTPVKITVTRGKTARFTVTLTPAGAFKSLVKLAVGGLQAHDSVTYSHNPAPASSTQTITIATSALDVKGTRTVRIGAASGSLAHVVFTTLVLQ